MEKKVTSWFTKGLIISLILIVFSLLSYFAGLNNQDWNKWAGAIIFIIAIIWACISYGKQMDNRVTFGNVFGHGFKVAVVVTIISTVFTLIFLAIFPDIKEQALIAARTNLEKRGNMSEEQIDQAMAMSTRLFTVFAGVGVLVVDLICGVIAALIGAAITKKVPTTPFDTTVNQA
jgi:hypothetical protein